MFKKINGYIKLFLLSLLFFWGIGSLFYFLGIMNVVDVYSVIGFSVSMSFFTLYYYWLAMENDYFN